METQWFGNLGKTIIGEPITIGKDTKVSSLDGKPYWLIPKSLNMKAMKVLKRVKLIKGSSEGIFQKASITKGQWFGSSLMLYYGVHDHNLDNDEGEKEEWTPDVAKEVLERTMAGCTQVMEEIQRLSEPFRVTILLDESFLN